MGANIKPIDPSMTIQKAITQGGYYNTDGDWNNVMTLDEHPGKIFRGRVEVLVLKDGKLFMYMKDNGRYRIPGGGFDKGVLNKDQAFIETKEEAKLIVDNIRFTGVAYTHIFEDPWVEEGTIPYDGNYNEVYIATYKEDYHGYIRKGLSDMELTNKGKFYNLDEVENFLKEPHKQALMNMLNGVVTENATDDDLILTARQFQTTLRNLHNKMDMYHCIQNRDIESDDGGWIFAEFLTTHPYEENEVKRFVQYCNEVVRTTIYRGVVEEPMSYKGHGFLFIKNDDTHQYESTYLIDESCVEFFAEASAKMKEGKYPVFIVNSNVGTVFGKLITTWTQSTYAHSSITLDTSLENLYSFNRSGFVKESLTEFKNFNENAPIQVSCLFVKKEDIKVIQERLDWLWNNKDKTKYALDNIINIMFNRPIETAKDSMTLVCSQFVTWLLSIADIKLIDKSLNLITPKDLANLHNPKVYLLYEGTVKDYDKKKIDRVFRKLKDKSQLIKND